MKLHFMKGKRSRSDLQVAVPGWENKVIGTESGKKACEKSTMRKEFFTWFKISLGTSLVVQWLRL